MGEILDGDMVAIGPPSLAVRSPAYQAFQNEFGDRATLVAVGARDGLVHVFRAVDGREVMTFLPRLAWRKVRDGSFQTDGPLAARDIAECRSLGEGSQACPAEAAQVNFRTMLVGGTGAGGPNLFGIDVTRISDDFTELGEDEPAFVVAEQFGDDSNRPYVWNVTDRTVGDSTVQVEKLGSAVSRPALTHVRENDEVKGAVVVGCGDDPERGNQELSDRPGRCVLVLEARTGRVIAEISNAEMTRPMVGDVAVYPRRGVAPAERAYLGDKLGRLWRIDLRSSDPAQWRAEIAWPPEDEDEALGYEIGKGITKAPALALAETGRLTVLFGNGDVGRGERSYVVSFTEELEVSDDGVAYAPRGNWVFPLAEGENLSGEVVVRSSVAFFTTIENSDVACASAQGRLYGVHFIKRNLNEDGEPESFRVGSGDDVREADVRPALPLLDQDGASGSALALLLPPGRVAFGLVIVATPSCTAGSPASTEIVLNLADESKGAQGRVRNEGLRVVTVNGGQGRGGALNGRLFTEAGVSDLSVCLDCDREGQAGANSATRVGPFPAVIQSWGSTFTN